LNTALDLRAGKLLSGYTIDGLSRRAQLYEWMIHKRSQFVVSFQAFKENVVTFHI
jgi:hypothetical protein